MTRHQMLLMRVLGVIALAFAAILLARRQRREHMPEVHAPAAPERITVGLPQCADLAACQNHCSNGDGEACFQLGNEYVLGSHLARDDVRAAASCESGCDHGSASACSAAGRLYEFGHGVTTDAARAFSLYERGCNGQSMVGCYNAALLLSEGRGVPRDERRAHDLFLAVCRAGSATACRHVEDGGTR